MTPDLNFYTKRVEGRFVFVAKQYGVIVWSDDIATGFKELEDRVQAVAAQYHEAGVIPGETGLEPRDRAFQAAAEQRYRQQYIPFFTKMAVLLAFAIGLLFIECALAERYLGANSAVGFAFAHPSQFLVEIGNRADALPPEKIDELKSSLRKIIAKIEPLVEEIRSVKSPDRSVLPPTSK